MAPGSRVSTRTRVSSFSPRVSIGPGGQDRPAQLAAGVGQGGLDRMEAIKPVLRRFRGGRAACPAGRPRLFRGFSGRFGVKMAAVFAEVFGAHGGAYKEVGAGVKPP